MTSNDRINSFPSLLKTAFNACSKIQREKYYEAYVPPVDMQYCCKSLFDIIKLNMQSFDPYGTRSSMFDKVQAANGNQFQLINEVAAFSGHLDCLIFAREIGVPLVIRMSNFPYTSVLSSAVSGGHIECLKYLLENGCEWDVTICSEAAASGHLDLLIFAHEHGCPWDQETCNMAALSGHKNCLEYAHLNGCQWDAMTCSCAAMGGHIDCLRYAHEHGCQWDMMTSISAECSGNMDCILYAYQNGCPRDEPPV